MKKAFTLLFYLLFLQQVMAAPTPGAKTLAGYFIENKGQVLNQKGTPSSKVLYYSSLNGMQVFITTTGYSICSRQETTTGLEYNTISIKLDSAEINAYHIIMVSPNQCPALNFYNPGFPNGLIGVKSTSTLIIPNIYPGIDWVWSFGKDGVPQNDFMVNEGADASRIHLVVDGANVNTKENIIQYTSPNLRAHEGPVIYSQLNKEVKALINVLGNKISFVIPNEFKNGGFTIDPPIQIDWSNGIDTLKTAFKSIVYDAAGNSFTTGYSADYALPVFPEINGSYNMPAPTNRDVVIMKTDLDQNIIWATFFGGSGNDQANAITATPGGIFITGFSESWNFPIATAGNYNHVVSLFGRDAFIAKFDDHGLWKWATGYGGDLADEAMDIKYYNGKIYVVGYTNSPNFPTRQLGGAYFYQDTTITNNDAFILEFDTSCNLNWGTCFGGAGDDYFTSVYADATGTYVTGYSNGTIPLQTFGSAYNQSAHQNYEGLITRFTTGDALQWSTYFGGTGNDYPTSIIRNNCGIFLCGKTDGTGLPVQDAGNGDFYQPGYGGGASDGFIVKLDPNTLQKNYCTYYGGTASDVLTKVTSDALCNTIFTGFTDGNLPAVHPSSFYYTVTQNAGGYDALMVGLNSSQQMFWSTLFGSDGNDFGYGLCFTNPYIVDMVGEGLYNYGTWRIGGTYALYHYGPYPLVTSNGESNRFFNVDSIGGTCCGGGGGGGINLPLYFQALLPMQNTCPNQCNGIARIDTNNIQGVPPYTSLWNNGGLGTMNSFLCENYWNRVTDAAGQKRTIYGRFNVLRVNPISDIRVSCNQVPNWTGLVLPQGGGPPYTIVDRGTTGNQCPNTEYFEVTDTADCVVSVSANWFVMNSQLTADLTIDPSCALQGQVNVGNNSHCVDLGIAGGWTYVIWSGTDTMRVPFSGSSDPQSLGAATPGHSYSGYLDMGGCSSPLADVFDYAPIQDSISYRNECQNQHNGNITLTVNADMGAVNFYGHYSVQYSLMGGASQTGSLTFSSAQPQSVTFANLASGNYVLVIYIPKSCDSVVTTINIQRTDLSLNTPTVFCGQHATLIATVQNAKPPVTYSWGPADSIVVSVAGSYGVNVTDGNGCNMSETVFVPGSSGMTVTINENLNPCTNTLLTDASTNVQGGTYPYTYLWSDGQTGSTANALPTGNNGVTVTDNFGCSSFINFSNTKKLPLIVTSTHTNVTCFGQSDGSIDLTITRGYPAYQVQWSDGLSGASRQSLSGGTYRYTVTDAQNCTSVGSIVVTEPPQITFTVSATPATCTAHDGGALVSATGGTPPLSIGWGDGGSTFSRNNLASGTQNFVITDNHNCSVTGSVLVQDTNTLSGQIYKTDAGCDGGSGSATVTLINATAPVTYRWSTGDVAPFLVNLSPNTYSVSVTDGSGCTYVASIIISAPPTPSIFVDTGLGILCFGQTAYVQIYASGGTQPYQYGGTSTGYDSAGYYNASVTDGNGCYASVFFSLTNPVPMGTATTRLRVPNCNDPYGVIFESTSGGTKPYSIWVDGIQQITYNDTITFDGVPGANDSIYIVDNNGCTLIQYPNFNTYIPPIGYAVGTSAHCYGQSSGSAEIIMQAGMAPFTVLGTSFDSTLTIPNLASGNYIYVVLDSVGCVDSIPVTIDQPTALVDTFIIGTTGVCNTDTTVITFFVYGGLPPYTGTGSFTYLPGNYYHVISDSLGCLDSIPLNVLPPPAFSADTIIGQPDCGNGLGTLRVIPLPGTGPYTLSSDSSILYLFQDSITIHLAPGTYTYHLTNSRGCEIDYTFTISVSTNIHGHSQHRNEPCHGDTTGSVTIVMDQGAPPYMINGLSFTDSITFQGLGSGSYGYSVTDVNGCAVQLGEFVSEPPALLIDSQYLVHGVTCRSVTDGEISIKTSGGTLPYSFSVANQSGTLATNSNGVFTGLAADNYTVKVLDNNQCQIIMPLVVPPYVPEVDSLVKSDATCNGKANGMIKILVAPGNRGPYSYNVNNETAQPYNVINNLPAGNYLVSIADKYNCVDTISTSIFEPDTIDGRLWLNGELMPIDSIVLNEQTLASFTKQNKLPWSIVLSPDVQRIINGDTLVQILPREDVTYDIKVFRDTVDATCFIEQKGLIELHNVADIPSIFTPNGDGHNDKWEIDLYKYPHSDITIFDRWGETVFKSADYNNEWDGTFLQTGRHVPDGTYFFIMKAPSLGGQVIRGDINILSASH